MNQKREGFTRKAFDILDRDHSGVVELNDIKGV